MVDEQDESPEEKKSRFRRVSLSGWNSLIDDIINEAREDGKFDNLQGEGKPIELEENPYANDKQLAYKLLKDNDFTLPWIDERKRILGDLDLFRAKIRRFWSQFAIEWPTVTTPSQQAIVRQRWQNHLSQWQGDIDALNRRIRMLNLQLPVRNLELMQLTLERELERIGARQEL